jgi:hypothetical protein
VIADFAPSQAQVSYYLGLTGKPLPLVADKKEASQLITAAADLQRRQRRNKAVGFTGRTYTISYKKAQRAGRMR